jgi:glucokinase
MVLAVGVDVGGTEIAAGVVDESGVVLETTRMPSPSDDPAELRQTIAEIVASMRTRHDVVAVGLGAAGFVAADGLEEVIGLPVNVENDGSATAWAEHRFGAGRGVDDQLTVTLGAGVGGGLILDSELYRGGHGIAAEIGHLGLVRDGRPCKCGRRGCLEQYASGSALERDAKAAATEGRAPGLLEAAGGDVEQVTGRMVSELAAAGDEGALALFDELAGALGTGLATLVAVLDPSLIVIGGGVSEAGEVVLRPTEAALRREVTGGEIHPAPELRLAELGDAAGLIGAADLARRHAGLAG